MSIFSLEIGKMNAIYCYHLSARQLGQGTQRNSRRVSLKFWPVRSPLSLCLSSIRRMSHCLPKTFRHSFSAKLTREVLWKRRYPLFWGVSPLRLVILVWETRRIIESFPTLSTCCSILPILHPLNVYIAIRLRVSRMRNSANLPFS